MSIKINSFGGGLVWLFRKYSSSLTSKIALEWAAAHYSKNIDLYAKHFVDMADKNNVLPFHNVMIETINRCNGRCAFCPASVQTESRPLKKMSEELFYKIIQELKEMRWAGKIFLCVNNEPYIDQRILDFSKYIKNNTKNIEIALISNGTLLSIDKLIETGKWVDQLIINDYSKKYKLSEQHRKIYDYVKTHESDFLNIDIVINRRFSEEILATRAGLAPNKHEKNNSVDATCIYPFTDLIIFPDGQVGMCCNDCMENSGYGDIKTEPLMDIWGNEKFMNLRKSMLSGRKGIPECCKCDVVDAGERENYLKKIISENKLFPKNG